MSDDYTDLRSVAAGMQQGFMQRGGYDNCLFMLRKVVEAANNNALSEEKKELSDFNAKYGGGNDA